MKEVMSNKKNLEAYGIMSLPENSSTLIQKKLQEKLKDPFIFTIHYKIREQSFNKALYDLGANINLIHLSIVEKFKLGKLDPTSLIIQIAKKSLKHPKGLIEDALVNVFDTKEDREIPILLGLI